MPFYEFECPKGHVSEFLVRIGTESVGCDKCTEEAIERLGEREGAGVIVTARRILSPTPTTFVCAGGRKL